MAVLDTTVLIDLMPRRNEERRQNVTNCIARLTAKGQRMATTRLNIAEIWVGIESASDRDRELSRSTTVLAPLPVLDFDERAARQFGAIEAYLRKIGKPAREIDTLIAAICLANGQSIVTRNKTHFMDIPGLKIESY